MKVEASIRALALAVLCALAAAASTAHAADERALAASKNCLACHALGQKVVGPAFKDVAAKYADKKDAVGLMVDSITKGSTGKWGDVAMPPNQVSAAEARRLAAWIVTMKGH